MRVVFFVVDATGYAGCLLLLAASVGLVVSFFV